MAVRLKSGFTVIEFLLYIAIIAIILLAATDVLFVVLDGKAKLQAVEAVTQNGRSAMARMTQALRNAQAVTTPSAGTTSTVLILQMATTSTNPTRFSLSNGLLSITEGSSATTTLIAEEATVTQLLFQNLGGTSTPAVIRIRLSVSSTNPALDPDEAYSETFYGSAAIRRRL